MGEMMGKAETAKFCLVQACALTVAVGVGAFVVRPADAADAMPGKGITVQPAQQTEVLSMFQVDIVNDGLEKLGYTVQPPKTLTVALYYTAIAQGDADFGVQAWWPGHKFAYEHAGGAAKMALLGDIVPGATQGYFVDKKTADQYHIDNIAQLKDPKIASLFAAEPGGKAGLIGCEPGWACEKIIDYQIKAYGLDNTVEQVSGTASVLFASVVSKYKSGNQILYYGFTPNWVSSVLIAGRDVTSLAVPFTALPADTANGSPNTMAPDGRNIGWMVNDLKAVANNDFIAKNPPVKRWLEHVSIPIADVNKEGFVIQNGEKSPEQIAARAREWIAAHQEEFDGWLKEAAAGTSK
jgi:glycine betaine/proline transport system substrate-binding protein